MSYTAFGQRPASLSEKLAGVTAKWDEKAKELDSYQGLKSYCNEPSFREETVTLLIDLHHLDSILYDNVVDKANQVGASAEIRLTLRDIQKVQLGSSTRDFVDFLQIECNRLDNVAQELATGDKKASKHRDALEKELDRYISLTTARIDLILEHVQHLAEE